MKVHLVVAGLVVALLAGSVATASATSTYDVVADAHIRGAVLFVGDSNETLAGTAISKALTSREDAYLPVLATRVGTGIRGNIACTTCAGGNYWKLKLAGIAALGTRISAVVVDLGINDAIGPGTATSPGYLHYGVKIDWLMRLLPPKVPILWTNLPCSIEQPLFRKGCKAVDLALGIARDRWPRLVVLNWGSAARNKPSYMGTGPHYSAAGYTAWASLLVDALDGRIAP